MSGEWIKALADGRRVKFTYQELPDKGAFITAQVKRQQSRLFDHIDRRKNPLSRDEVRGHFEGELLKK
jgi:hypothetical protein